MVTSSNGPQHLVSAVYPVGLLWALVGRLGGDPEQNPFICQVFAWNSD